MRDIKQGSADQSTIIRVVDATDGTPETGVAFDTSGIDLWYRREGGAKVSITEATLAAVDSAHSDGGFIHIADGYCRLDLPDAACASGSAGVTIGGTITDMVVIGSYHALVGYDPTSAALPADVTKWNGTAVATPDTAGYPKVTLKTGSGTGELDVTSGVAKANLAQILGTALTETAGQIAAAFKKFLDIASPTGTANLSPADAVKISGSQTAADGLELVGTAASDNGNGVVDAAVNSIDSAPLGAIADAVLDEVLSGNHDTAGTPGKLLQTLPSSGTVNTTTPLSASGVRTAVGLASANLDTQLEALPTAAENAAALLAATNGAATVADQLAHLDADVSDVDGGVGGSTTVLVAPLQTSVVSPLVTTAGATRADLTLAQNATTSIVFAVTDGDGDAVDLSGKTLRFVIHDETGTVRFSLSATITVSGADNNQVTVPVTATQTVAVANLQYKLWNVTDTDLLGTGQFNVILAPIGS